MLTAHYEGANIHIDVKNNKFVKNNSIVVTIGELEITVGEADAKYLLEELEDKLLDYNWTRNGLESRIDDLEQENEHLEEELKSIRGW